MKTRAAQTETFFDLGPNQAHVRLLATSDLHMHVLPYDYFNDCPRHDVGLAQLVPQITRLREAVPTSFLFDNGDFLQGTPMGDLAAHPDNRPRPHPMVSVMNALGYDAATLGNHEFNYGLDMLQSALSNATFPIVSANAILSSGPTPTEDRTLVPPHILISRTITMPNGQDHPLTLGVIGLLPPQILHWDRRNLEGRLTARPIPETARAHAAALRQAGADLVIALAHTGIAGPEDTENAALPLAATGAIDVLILGHQHLIFPSERFADHPGTDVSRGTIHGVPAVMPGFWGSHLGCIDLALTKTSGGWHIDDHHVAAQPIDSRPDLVTPSLLSTVRDAHDETLAHIRAPVGHSTIDLHSYFALIAPSPALQIVAEAQRWNTQLHLADTAYQTLPILSAVAPFKSGGRSGPAFYTDIPAGPLAMRHIADLYYYPNKTTTLLTTGKGVRDWLERAAAQYAAITPGVPDQRVIPSNSATYNFDTLHGVTYEIDLGQPPGFAADGTALMDTPSRIKNLCHNGDPIDPSARFVVATNGFRAAGGGAFASLLGSEILLEGPDTNRDVVLRYVRAMGQINALPAPHWRFSPLPGTTLHFDSGPGAMRIWRDVPNLALTPHAHRPNGYQSFTVAL